MTALEQIPVKAAELLEAIEKAKVEVASAARRAAENMEPFIGKQVAAEYLNISVSTLEKLMAERTRPPSYMSGGKRMFRRSELLEWMQKYRS